MIRNTRFVRLVEEEAFPIETRHWSCSKNKYDFLFWTTFSSILVEEALAVNRVLDLDGSLLPVSSFPKDQEMVEPVTFVDAEGGTTWAPPKSAFEEPYVTH